MKKLLKSLLAIAAAFLMVFSLGTAVNAEGVTITINDKNGTGTYVAYKLMSLSVDSAFSKFTYTVNPDYSISLQNALNVKSDDEVIAKLSNNDSYSDSTSGTETTGSAGNTNTFAKAVYDAVKLSTNSVITANNGVFENVAPGYYLIVETREENATNKGTNPVSLVMLTTAGNNSITVNTKESVPTVTKKVMDVNDSTGETFDWQDSADYDIGDDVPFKLTGTVSSEIAKYDTYSYQFTDTLSDGFDAAKVTSVKIDGKEVGSNSYVVSTDKDTSDNSNFRVTFIDLKKCSYKNSTDGSGNIPVTANSEVVIEYTAKLNDNAVIGGTGNPNTVYLNYQNNPYYTGEGYNAPGKTTEDKVIVFTYKTVFNKVDENNKPLKGAAFKLQKFDYRTSTWKDCKAPAVTNAKDSDGNTVENAVFTFSGLDDGKYKLIETTHPDGYKSIDDIVFEITAGHDVKSDNPTLTSLTGSKNAQDSIYTGEISFAQDVTNGSLTTSIQNTSGSKLPSTGGIGTTIFYVCGGSLVAVAAVLLISKKRASAE